MFRDINRDPFMMYPIEGSVSTVAHKVFLLVQMELSRVELANIHAFDRQRLRAEAERVLGVMHRLIRAVIDCKGSDSDGPALWAALELARSMSAKAWEDRPVQLQQVPQLGPVLMRKLVSTNIRTVHQLAELDSGNIERIASRNPPFGKKMEDCLAFFPRLTLDAAIKDIKVGPQGNLVVHIDVSLGFTNSRGNWNGKIPIVTFLAVTTEGTPSYFCRESLRVFDADHNTHRIHFTWTPNSIQEVLNCRFACEDIVGTVVATEVRHNLPTSAFLPQIKNDQLLSAESQRLKPSQMSSTFLTLEKNMEHGKMLKILDDVTCRRAFDKRDEIDADIDDHDLLAMLDPNEAFERRPTNLKEPQKLELDLPTCHGYQGLDKSVRPSLAAQRGAGVSGERPRRKSPKHKTSSQFHNEGPVEDNPIRLPNGRYKCGHACSQVYGGTTARGDKCGHDCCRNGSKYPPKKHHNNVKRKDPSFDEANLGFQPVPDFSSNPPPKRVRMNNATKSKTRPPEMTSSLTHDHLAFSRRRKSLDFSLCDVDGDGIIDLTGDDKNVGRAFSRAGASRPSNTANSPRTKRSATRKAIGNDDMMGDLSDEDFIDIGSASEAADGGQRATMPNENSNSTDFSDEIASPMLLNEIQDKTDYNVLYGRDRMADADFGQDEEYCLDATRRNKKSNMGHSHVAEESMVEFSSPPPISSDETISIAVFKGEEPITLSTAGVWSAPLELQRANGTTSSTHRTNAIIANPRLINSVEGESVATELKAEGEPDWVSDFDPVFISEFRGLVDFV